jgi:hypothetical protein
VFCAIAKAGADHAHPVCCDSFLRLGGCSAQVLAVGGLGFEIAIIAAYSNTG